MYQVQGRTQDFVKGGGGGGLNSGPKYFAPENLKIAPAEKSLSGGGGGGGGVSGHFFFFWSRNLKIWNFSSLGGGGEVNFFR